MAVGETGEERKKAQFTLNKAKVGLSFFCVNVLRSGLINAYNIQLRVAI